VNAGTNDPTEIDGAASTEELHTTPSDVGELEAVDADLDGDVVTDDSAEVEDDGTGRPGSRADLLEREGEVAADYLEGLLDIVDADGDIDMDVEGQRAVVSIVGERLRHLVGPGGVVLDALQELTRLAVARETGVRSRLMLDVGGHRARRRLELTELGSQAAQQAIAEGAPVRLAPMTAFERKVVHDAVAAAGLRSESEGVDPQRFVIVLPAGAPRGSGSTEIADDVETESIDDAMTATTLL
jgi:spoIIIJ-associated protein